MKSTGNCFTNGVSARRAGLVKFIMVPFLGHSHRRVDVHYLQGGLFEPEIVVLVLIFITVRYNGLGYTGRRLRCSRALGR